MNQTTSGGGNEKEILNNCIGNLEHHVHKVFAAVRVPGEDFVYSASLDLFSKLDDYCDGQFMSEARLPLLIKGESGTGKSALLSNWLQKRERNSKRDEFIFWHAVGCSRQSMNVNSLIRRLIVDLKNRFELTRPIPKSQERLSWELPRFLELVAKRGNTIIVIDGLNRLVNNDNTEDGLAWLPLEFPPHIRVILSVTIPPNHGSSHSSRPTTPLRDRSSPTHAGGMDGSATPSKSENMTPFSPAKASSNRIDEAADEDGDKDDDKSIEAAVRAVAGKSDKPVKNKKSRILQELDRRQIPSIVLKPLDKFLCRSLVETFIQKSVNSEAAALATGPYITTFMNSVKQLAAQEGVDVGNGQIVAGFLLFENQITALLNHQQGGTPLFLRLFLRCLQYAVSRGFSLWQLYEDWMQANSVPALLIRILQTLEEGSVRHRNSAQEACDKTIAAGGLPALREIYSWHPSFQEKPESEVVVSARANSSPLPDVDFSKLKPRSGESFSGVPGGDGADGNVLINANRRAPASVSIELLKSAISNQTTPTVVTHTAVSMEDIQLVSEAEANNNDKSSSNGQGQNPLSTSVSQNLGDQQWVSVAEQVHKKLQLAIASSNKLIEDTLNNAKQMAVQNNTDYVSALVQNIRSLHIQYAEANNRTLENWDTPAEKPAARDVLSNVKQRQRAHLHSSDLSVSTKGENGYAEDEYSATLSDSDVDSLDESVEVDGLGNLPQSPSPVPGAPNTPGGVGQQPRDSKFFAKNTFDNVPRKPSMIENVKPSEMASSPSKHGGMARAKSQSKLRSSPSRGSSISETVSHVKVVDPSEGLTSLPIYLRGGVTTAGFGEILGNALALLYVARQGLHEHELWKILSTLQYKKEKSLRESLLTKEAKALNNMIIRNLATQILQCRGELRDIFKSDDTSHTGYITLKQMHLCTKKLFPSTKQSDLVKLLDFIESNTEDAPVGDLREVEADDVKHNPLRMRGKVHYMKLISLLVKLNKHFKFGESKISNMKSNGTSSKDVLSMAKQSSHLKKRMASAVIAAGNAPDMHTDDNDYNNFNLKVSASAGDILAQTNAASAGIDGPVGGVTEMYPASASHKDGAVDPDDEDDDDGENFTLGPVIEESLLSILAALGVLYSPENKVLILPSDSEPFRKVIFEEYILSRGGKSLHYWHHLIIQYFQTEPNSLRKCEELPWHLKICKKWNTLRDTLVDLKTFDLMFNNDLKDELMEYWLLLTEGPLYVNDPNAHSADKANMRISFMAGGGLPVGGNREEDDESTAAGSTYSHILRDIDQAMEMKVSVKDARKKLFKNQLQPFDVVEELNKSLETWVATTRPSPLQVHKTITQISKFLAEFSKVMSQTPTFQRMGIDLASLQMFGVSLEDVKEYLGPATNPTATALLAGTAGEAGAEDGNGQTPGKRGSKALTPTPKDESDGYFENSAKEQAPKFPTPMMISSSLYPFLRWIWMQFPWIALYPAATLFSPKGALAANSADHDIGGVSTPDTSAPSAINSDTARLLRVWNCKKSDPTVPVFNLSSNRKLAAIKPRTSLSQSLERNVEVAYKAIYEELTAPSLIAQVKLGVGLHKDKFRRSYEEELAANKNIPFAYHGARITKSESLFPSYKAFISNSNKEKLKSEYDLDDGAGSKSRKRLAVKPLPKFNLQDALSAGGLGGGTFMTELDSEIQKMGKEEFVQNHKVDRASGALIVDENDLEYEASLSRIERMKTIRNKLSIITRAKMNIITDLDNQIMIRNESDAQLISEVNASELLIKSLNERNLIMDQNMEEAKQLHEGYTELLRVLKHNPPYIESHVQALEVEVDLANKQFEDLCAHRKSLYEEAERLDTYKRKQLQERINYYVNARKEVAAKKKQVMREMKHMRDPHAYDGGGSGRHINSRGKNHMDNDSDSSVGSADSGDDESQQEEEVKDIALTKPVIHFINALVRKQTFGESIVKEGDKTLEDVKHRVKNSIIEQPNRTAVPKKKHRQGSHLNLASMLKSDSGSLNGEDKLSDLPSAGGGGPGSPFTHANVIAGFGGKRKFSKEQQAQMKESLRSINAGAAAGGSHQSPTEKESFKGAVQKTMMFLFEKTESSNVDEFIERFLQGQKLLDAMKNQQMLVDSKVVQLGKDKIELEKELEAIAFRDGGSGIPGGSVEMAVAASTTSSAEDLEEDRYLDDQLFKKEVALHQLQRKYDSAVHLISEVQTSITHVMNMLVINNKLLSVLPKSQPPVIKQDSDIFAAILWCEDRIMALNEALAMDANRPNGATAAEENMPMFKRQVELAELINEMQKVHQKKIRSLNAAKQAKKQVGGLAKGLISTGDKGTYVSSPRAIVVTPMAKIDKIFDSKMEKVIAKRDKMHDAYESSISYDAKKETRVDITKFLSESLAKNMAVTKDLSRKANQLQNKRQGRHMSYGLVLDNFLAASGQSMEDAANKDSVDAGGVHGSSVAEGKDGTGALNVSTVMSSSIASIPNVGSVNSPTNSVK